MGNEIFVEYEKNSFLNSNLKKLFREKYFLEGTLSQSIHESLSRFIKTNDETWAPSDQVYDLFKEKELLSLLYECKLLKLVSDKVILNHKYNNNIKTKTSKQVQITQKQIDHQLRLMNKIGDIAEELVIKYKKIG